MWAFTDDGFLSVVEFDPPKVKIKDAVYGKKEDGTTDYQNIIEPTVRGTDTSFQEYIDKLVDYVPAGADGTLSSHLLVRARVEADMNPLKDYDPNAVFFSDMTADYQFRCIISRFSLALYVANKVMNINYSSHVKETINSRAPKIEGGRMTGLSSTWSAISKWQPNPPYGAVSGSMYGYAYGSAHSSSSGSNSYYGGSYSKSTQDWWDKKNQDADDKKVLATLDTMTDEEWDEYPSLHRKWLDAEDVADDPAWEMTELEMRINTSGPSEETMRLQLKDIFAEDYTLADINLDAAVEAVIDAFGTCDIVTIQEESLYQVLDSVALELVMDDNASE